MKQGNTTFRDLSDLYLPLPRTPGSLCKYQLVVPYSLAKPIYNLVWAFFLDVRLVGPSRMTAIVHPPLLLTMAIPKYTCTGVPHYRIVWCTHTRCSCIIFRMYYIPYAVLFTSFQNVPVKVTPRRWSPTRDSLHISRKRAIENIEYKNLAHR